MQTNPFFKICNLLKSFVFIWLLFSFGFPFKSKETYRLLSFGFI